MNKKKFSTKFLVEMALLVAIILIMAFTPLGYIKTAGIEITLIVVRACGWCNFRRCIWTCQFFALLRTECIWCDAS